MYPEPSVSYCWNFSYIPISRFFASFIMDLRSMVADGRCLASWVVPEKVYRRRRRCDATDSVFVERARGLVATRVGTSESHTAGSFADFLHDDDLPAEGDFLVICITYPVSKEWKSAKNEKTFSFFWKRCLGAWCSV